MNPSTNDLVARYLQTFNETDATRRRAALRELYVADCGYTDAHAALRGPDAIDAFIAAVQKDYPGMVFALRGAVDAHHEQARFAWQAGPRGGAPVAAGFDVVVLDGGRIRQVYGFTDPL